jgi:hypothetical protein
MLASERQRGVFSRQLVLGENLDTERIDASYQDGVLRLRIPVAERAKPRKIAIGRVLRLRIPVAERAKPRKIAIGRTNGHAVINA